MAKRYVWINIVTGEFSNSWSEQEHNEFFSEEALPSKKSGWKLISYECLNDEAFSFNKLMVIR